jgi:hypothetical protein
LLEGERLVRFERESIQELSLLPTTTKKVICSGSKLSSVVISEPLLIIEGYQQQF